MKNMAITKHANCFKIEFNFRVHTSLNLISSHMCLNAVIKVTFAYYLIDNYSQNYHYVKLVYIRFLFGKN
jgi:hypothetical protein